MIGSSYATSAHTEIGVAATAGSLGVDIPVVWAREGTNEPERTFAYCQPSEMDFVPGGGTDTAVVPQVAPSVGTDADGSPPSGGCFTGPARPAVVGASVYARMGGAAAVRRVVDEFYMQLMADADLAVHFGAELGVLKWHQAGQMCLALGGPDRFGFDPVDGYPRVVVPPVLYRRAVASLLGAVYHVPSGRAVLREAFQMVGSAVARRRCLVIAGRARAGALVPAEEGLWVGAER